jgi:glycosyltransferase involved in cell wall biosynthesis
MTPRISIITPVYNAIRYLPETWESIRAQTFTDWEWMVWEDGSDDGSLEWLQSLAAADPRVRVLHGERTTLPAAGRNRAIASARGELLALLDADDLWEPGKLAAQVALLDTHRDVDFVYTWAAEFWSPDSGIDAPPILVWRRVDVPEPALPFLLAHGNITCTSSIVVRRALVRSVGPYNEDLRLRGWEDYEWNLRAAAVGRLARAEGVQVRYRLHRTNISSTPSPERHAALLESVTRHGLLAGPGGRAFLSNHHLQLAELALDNPALPHPAGHLWRAFLHRPADPRRAVPLLLAPLPRPLLRRAYGWLKRLQRRLTPGTATAHRMTTPWGGDQRPKNRV